MAQRLLVIKPTAVRSAARDAGRRVSREFLEALDRHVIDLIGRSAAVHNGGKKTLDAAVLGFVTGKLR